MQASEQLVAAVKQFEGFRASAYRDSGGVVTIGYGHTGWDVKMGETITPDLADLDLRAELAQAASEVSQIIHVDLAQWQFDALVDFQFNIGKLGNSTLKYLLNKGDYDGAAQQFPRWCHDGNQVLPGLYIRRKAEMLWFRNAMLVSYPTDAQYQAWLAEANELIVSTSLGRSLFA